MEKSGRMGAADPHRAAWWPGLDALRGIALGAMLLYHHAPGALEGGFLSVSLFFTLSGFLITTLLLAEHDRAGRIDLKAFWSRRVRRLLPVAVLGLALALVIGWVVRDGTGLEPLALDVWAAVANVANWRFVAGDVAYAALDQVPSPVTHYWSLAVEEQYYLVYPALAAVALRWRRVGLAALLAVLTAVSIIAMWRTGGDRAYFGTDTRLAELTIGGLSAVGVAAWRDRRPLPRPALLDAMGGACAVGVVALWATVPLASPSLFRGITVLHAVLAAGLVVAAVHGRRLPSAVARWLPVRLGVASYAIYVVHLPLFQLLDEPRLGVGGVLLLAIRVLAAVGLGALVHVAVENPVRFGRHRTGRPFAGRQGALAAVTAMASVLVVAAALPQLRSAPDRTDLLFGDEVAVVAAPTPTLPSTTAPPTTAPPPPTVEATTVGDAPTPTPDSTAPVEAPPAPPPPPAPERVLRILMAGDSSAGTFGGGMQTWAERTGLLAVDRAGGPGCVLHQDGVAHLRVAWDYIPTAGCEQLVDVIIREAVALSSDVVILHLGSVQLADWLLGSTGQLVSLEDPGYAAAYQAALDRALTRLASEVGVPVLVAAIPVPAWQPSGAPGVGELTMNSAPRTAILNALGAEVVARHPIARVVAFDQYVARPDGTVDPAVRPDGLHVEPAAVPAIMDAGLAEAIESAYRDVVRSVPGAARPGVTVWNP